MRGMVLKSHYEPTASMAYLVSKVVPGIAVFGGIDLNRSVGGSCECGGDRAHGADEGRAGQGGVAADVRCGEPGEVLEAGPAVRAGVEGSGRCCRSVRGVIGLAREVRADTGDGALVGGGVPADRSGGEAGGGEKCGGDPRHAGAGSHDCGADEGSGGDGGVARVRLQCADRRQQGIRVWRLCEGDARGGSGALHRCRATWGRWATRCIRTGWRRTLRGCERRHGNTRKLG